MRMLHHPNHGRNKRQFRSAENLGKPFPRLSRDTGELGRDLPFNYIPLTMHSLAKVRR